MTIKLFVGNLPYSITEEQLKEAFAQSGRNVHSVRIALDRETQRPRGFAFIEMATDQDADSAIKELHNQMLQGRTIFVEKAQERAPGGPRPHSSSRPPREHSGPPRGPSSGPPSYGNTARPYSNQPSQERPWSPRPPRPNFQAAHFEEPKIGGRRHKTKPDKKGKEKKSSGRPEERERGKWRWDGNDDY